MPNKESNIYPEIPKNANDLIKFFKSTYEGNENYIVTHPWLNIPESALLTRIAAENGLTNVPHDFKQTIEYLANNRYENGYRFFYLYYGLEMTYKEIAEKYHIHPSTVRKHVTHVYKLLHHEKIRPILQNGIDYYLGGIPFQP